MDAAQLQAAVARFLASGGEITQADAARAAERQAPADDPALVNALRGYRYITQAARALHISTRTVGRLASAHGLEFASNNSAIARGARRNREAALVARIRRMAGSMGREKMAAALGISVGALRRMAREHNINISSRNTR